MDHLTLSVLRDSPIGVARRLERAGGALENAYIYNDVAVELKELARSGWVDVLVEELSDRGGETLIDHITFVRRR